MPRWTQVSNQASHEPSNQEVDHEHYLLMTDGVSEWEDEVLNGHAFLGDETCSQSDTQLFNATCGSMMRSNTGPLLVESVRDHRSDTGLLDSLDYDCNLDDMQEQKLSVDPLHAKRHARFLSVLRFVLTLMIAFFIAMIGYGLYTGLDQLCRLKFDLFLNLVTEGQTWYAFFFLMFTCCSVNALAASLITFIAPEARASGVAYVLAYLNGTNLSRYFSLRILVVKVAALILTIAAGTTLGLEGPFIHIGACVAVAVSQQLLRPLHFLKKYAPVLRNIKEERFFISGGAAAGLAVAFNAPIAGVLFAIEGSFAFLTVSIALRIFVCALFASLFANLGYSNFRPEVHRHSIIERVDNHTDYSWMVFELIPFLILGVLGGVLGALATWINLKVSKWRHHRQEHGPKLLNILEAVIFTALTVAGIFFLPYLFGCKPVHPQCSSTQSLESHCKQLFCEPGHYSEIGSMVFSTPESISRILFDRTILLAHDFNVVPLLVTCAFYLLIASLVYGVFVPGGLFVPAIVIGGLFGRCFGIGLAMLLPSASINTGVYALFGAASMLGGFTRLTLPIVVMLVEMTDDAQYLLPIMICTMTAKILADHLHTPLYPGHMALEKLPVLGEKLPKEVEKMKASQLMIRNPKTVRVVERFSSLVNILHNTNYHQFPVTDREGRYIGMIARPSISYAIQHLDLYRVAEDFFATNMNDTLNSTVAGNLRRVDLNTTISLSSHAFKEHSALREHIRHLSDRIEEDAVTVWVNLTSLVDKGTFSAMEETSAKRIQKFFRRIGSSHLCVTDSSHQLLGMITRKELVSTKMVQSASHSVTRPANHPVIVVTDPNGHAKY